MISLEKSYNEYKEIENILRGIKDLDTFVAITKNNKDYNITNDLRDRKTPLVDCNYKSLCVTIQQVDNHLTIVGNTEVWSDTGCTMISVNFASYYRYNTKILNDRVHCYSNNPYDEQDYHYSYDNKIYRQGNLVEVVTKEEMYDEMSLEDNMILRLIDLDRPLQSKMCHN